MGLLKGHLIISQLASAPTSIQIKLRYEQPRIASNQGRGGLASNQGRDGLPSNQDKDGIASNQDRDELASIQDRDGQTSYEDKTMKNHNDLFYPKRYSR